MPPIRIPDMNGNYPSAPSRRFVDKTDWSDAELEMVRVGRRDNKGWKQIANEVNETFGKSRSVDAYKMYFQRHGETSAEWTEAKVKKLRQAIKSTGAQKRVYMEALKAWGEGDLEDMSMQEIEKKYKEIIRNT